MKYKAMIFNTVLVCMILQSCEIVQISQSLGLEKMTFTSDLQPDTRTSLVDGKKVHWTEGDAISIFDNSSWSNSRFAAESVSGNKATFSGFTKADATEYYALYPYQEGSLCESTATITVRLPGSQRAVPGTFDTGLNISVAKAEGGNLFFRNVCALVKVAVPEDITDIVSLSLSSSCPLAGDMKIVFDDAGNPSMTPVSSASVKEISISNDGNPLSPGAYYFVIAPGDHKFTLRVRLSDGGMYSRTSASVLTIAANAIINSGNVPSRGVSLKVHPCALVSSSDLERVRAAVAAADEADPVYAAYKSFCNNTYAQSSRTANPVATIVRGDVTGTGVEKENYMNIARDAVAAFQLALRWQITGDTSCADAAVGILNAWADVCTQINANDNNQYLCAGFQGHALGNAAELLRDYEGWAAADQDDFKTWLRNVWIAKNEWFIDTHGGPNNCSLHYWSNWELANLASMLAIGIYLEDTDLINKVYVNFSEGAGSGCIDNMIPYEPVPDPDGYGMLAQSMESGRDQGHGTLVASICAELCQMAWNIGLDFWGMKGSKVLSMCEYTAKYNVKPDGKYICTTMPFTPYSYCPSGCGCANHSHGQEHTVVSETGRGTVRPCWDLIYSHYRHIRNESADNLHYVKLFADQLRSNGGVLTGDGGPGDSRYGTNSGAFDQLGWGTMLFYRGE